MDRELSRQGGCDKGKYRPRRLEVAGDHLIARHPIGLASLRVSLGEQRNGSADDRQLQLLSMEGRQFAGLRLHQRC